MPQDQADVIQRDTVQEHLRRGRVPQDVRAGRATRTPSRTRARAASEGTASTECSGQRDDRRDGR